jgi:hypothetical protein
MTSVHHLLTCCRRLFAVIAFCVMTMAAVCGQDPTAPVAAAPAAKGTEGSAQADASSSPKSSDAPTTANAKTTAPSNGAADPEYKETPPEKLPYKPYDVDVVIGFDGPEFRIPSVRDALVREIQQGLSRMYGPMWKARVAESNWFIPGNRDRIERLQDADLKARYPSTATEKVIVLAVAGSMGQFQVSCREFDARVEELTPVRTESTFNSASLPNIACRLTRDSFRPFLLFTGRAFAENDLEFFLQAGTISPPDPTAAQITDGDVMRTFLRQMDRRNPGQVKLLQKLDLCYIRVTEFMNEIASTEDPSITIPPLSEEATEVRLPAPATITDGAHVRGLLIVHGLVPFGGRGRNLQQIALRQRPAASSSKVKLVLKNRPDRPLICYRVDRVAKLAQKDENVDPPVRFLTDRNGELEIVVDEKNPTYWLYVYSGSILLARVPYAPGLVPRDTMRLPDDTLRLGVEGELYLLRDQLVDMVAQKAVFMSLAKKAAAEGNTAGLEDAITQLDALPGQKFFADQLNRIQTPAVNKANQQKNAGAKRSIDKLCTKMGESLTAFFATDKRVKEADEIEKLRQSAAAKAK